MKYYIVDVFADKKFSGNQLAVCLPKKKISSKNMQKIAKEFNFSETTFIYPKPNGDYKVNVFTPDVEVPFAGHPTLGTAFVINEILNKGTLKKAVLKMKIVSIPVKIKKNLYEMKQKQPKFGKIFAPEEINNIISLEEKQIIKGYPIQIVSTGLPALIVPLKSKEALNNIRINHQEYEKFLKKYGPSNILCFYIQNDKKVFTRVFVDDIGYGEDPATGSATGDLAAYLLKHNVMNKDEIQFTISQGTQVNRPSTLYVNAKKKKDKYIIKVSGKVFLIADGHMKV